MSYELKTEKVNLGGGNGFGPFKKQEYALFYQEFRHVTQREVNQLTRRFLKFSDGKSPTLVIDGEGKPNISGGQRIEVEVDLAAVDWDAVNDAIIVNQVKEWSFGTVSQETLDGLPETTRGRLVKEINRLYGQELSFPKVGGGN
jgi:hypothetical protein